MIVTVVIPVKNGADHLARQLQALTEQTVRDFEVVVSDNGSTDATRDVALAWADRFNRLRVVDSSQCPGVSHARNVGIRAATTPAVVLCDSDDLVCPAWVDSMATGLDTYDIVGGPLELSEINPPRVLDLIGDIRSDALPDTLRYLPYAYGGNCGIRRVVFDRIGYFDPAYRGHEEVDFCWRAQEAGFTIGFAPGAVLHYRQRADVWGVAKQRFYFGRSNAQLQANWRRPGMPPFTGRRQVRVLLQHLREARDLLRQPDRDRWIIGAGWVLGRLVGYATYRKANASAVTTRSVLLEAPRKGLVQRAKELKHQAFLVRKHALLAARPATDFVADRLRTLLATARPYRFDPSRYRGSFVAAHSVPPASNQPLPRRIFVCWTGTNPLSANRLAGLTSLRALNSEIPVILVGPENVEEWLVEGHPLPSAYENLSLVHRSDYLRAYLLHHHGGGYADVKRYHAGWGASFDAMDADPTIWAMGYPEVSARMAAQVPGRLGRHVRLHFSRLIGNGSYLVRPGTPLTAEWLAEAERRVESYEGLLAETPGDARGDNEGYPIGWTEILGEVFEPLCLKYLPHVRQERALQPDFHDYQ